MNSYPRPIICVGFGKCGTTLLHEMFSSVPSVSTPEIEKEIKAFFKDGMSRSSYFSYFDLGKEVTHTFESSPPYVTSTNKALRLRALGAIRSIFPNAIIVVCLRNPVYRAISHYLYNLHPFAIFGYEKFSDKNLNPLQLLNNAYKKSFEESLIYDVNTFISYYEVFTEVLEAFPAQNVVPFYLEHDSKDLTPFLERMENATGERFRPTEEWLAPKKVWGTDTVPGYIYARKEETVSTSLGLLTLNPKELLCVSNRGCRLFSDVPAYLAEELLRCEEKWTIEFSKIEVEAIFDRVFKHDVNLFAELLDVSGFESRQIRAYLDVQEFRSVSRDKAKIFQELVSMPTRI